MTRIHYSCLQSYDHEALDEAVALGQHFFENSENKLHSFDYTTAYHTWKELLSHGMARIFTARDMETKELAGILLCTEFPEANTGIMTISEQGWYVKPEYRKVGIGLFHRFESYVEQVGAQSTVTVMLSSPSSDKLERLLAKRGYEAVDVVYRKER